MLDEPVVNPVEAAEPSLGQVEPAPVREAAPVLRVETEPRWRRRGQRAVTLATVATGITLASIALGAALSQTGIGDLFLIGLLAVPPLTFASLLYGLGALGDMLRATEPVDGRLALTVSLFPVLGGGIMTLLEVIVLSSGFARGRQLRRWGHILLPRVAPGGAWTKLDLAPQVPAELRTGMAAQWRDNGRTEHASVAAFARLSLDLLALGAPPRLLDDANRDARDEIRHAELCFSLARALDGESASPAAFPEARRAQQLPVDRSRALASLAVDSLVDGALREGVSARVVARLARRCEDPAIRALLQDIAADEGRHSAHGWDVVEWCLSEGGAPVAAALRGTLALMPSSVRSSTAEVARDGAWEPWGIPGQSLEEEEHRRALAGLRVRVERLTADSAAVRAA